MTTVSQFAKRYGVSKPFTAEQSQEQFTLLTTGDTLAAKRLIEGNMGLVVYAVRKLIAERPECGYLTDDLMSEGFLALTHAVNRLHTKKLNPIRLITYLRSSIKHSVAHLIEAEGTIRIPRATRQDAKKRQAAQQAMPDGVHTSKYGRLNKPPASDDGSQLDQEVILADYARSIRPSDPDHADIIELRDLIFSCAMNDIERQFLKLAEDSYTNVEIGEKLGLTTKVAWGMRKRLEKRFLKKSGMKAKPKKSRKKKEAS